ncbi:hypothetical protein ACFQVC_41280, partial [Streptomyces monticola]
AGQTGPLLPGQGSPAPAGRTSPLLTGQVEPLPPGGDPHRRLAWLDAETANLRAALDSALRAEGAEGALLALRLTCALSWYWMLRGRLAEARRSLRAALDRAEEHPGALYARAAAWHIGVTALEGAATGTPRTLAPALEGLAGAQVHAGEPMAAAALLGAAAAARQSAGAPLPVDGQSDVLRMCEAVRDAIGEAEFSAAYDRGRTLSPEALKARGVVAELPGPAHQAEGARRANGVQQPDARLPLHR